MSDAIDRAAEVINPSGGHWLMDRARDIARALDRAGRLVTPEHDAKVAAEALREAAGELNDPAITPRIESAADAVIHLYERADWIEEEAGESDADCNHDWGSPFEMPEIGWDGVRECADCGAIDRIERKAGESNAER